MAGGRAKGQVGGCSGTTGCQGSDAGRAGGPVDILSSSMRLPHGAAGELPPQPLLPTSLGRAHLPPSRPGGPGAPAGQGVGAAPHCLRGTVPLGGPARCMSVAVAFVRGLSVRVCPSVCVSISQEIKLCTPSLAAWGRGLGGAGGAASHHRICMLMGPSPPNINFLFLWFGTNGAGPAQLPPPTWPCGGTGSGPWALTLASPPPCLSPHPPVSACPHIFPGSELDGVTGEAAGVHRPAEGREAAGALALPAGGHGGQQEGGPAGRLVQG